MTTIAADVLAALTALHGEHPGARAAHAKGTLCRGAFTAAPAAARLSRAAHLRGEAVPVTARFSNGSGDPTAPDGRPGDGRGLAVKFYLPDGSTTDIVALSLPVFFVRTAADFLDFTRARRPDPETGQPDMARVGAFLGQHPETAAALGLILPALTAPESYARCAYNSLHAFRLVDAGGRTTAGRYRWEPEAGEATLPDQDVEPDHLQRELRDRLGRAPVRFRLLFTIAEAEDDLSDPTVAWPPERRRVELGVLELDGLDTTRETGGDVLVFDPTRVAEGVECSDDELLGLRSDVYALSVERRTGVRRAVATA